MNTTRTSTTPSPTPRTVSTKSARRSAPRKSASAPQKKAVKTAQTSAGKKATPVQVGKKIKRVRDSFSMPRDEYEVLGLLKQRSATLGRPSKKSELLRAGLKLLAALNDKALLAALQALPPTRTSKPAQG